MNTINDTKHGSRIEKFLAQFPDNATNWGEATDEIRELARDIRTTYNEMELDVLEDDQKAIKAIDFRGLQTPAEWNRKAKAQIREIFPKLKNRNKEAIIARFQDWL